MHTKKSAFCRQWRPAALNFALLSLLLSLVWAHEKSSIASLRRRSLQEVSNETTLLNETVASPSSSVDDERFGIDSSTDAQNFLVIASAVLAIVKGLMSVATYSYFHVVLAVVELICTGIACAIYVVTDFQPVAENSIMGNDVDTSEDGLVLDTVTRHIFLLAYVQACTTEWLDVLTTYQTVLSPMRMHKTDAEEVKGKANSVYVKNLILTLVCGSAIPIILFWKADWETNSVVPQNFSERNGKFLLVGNACLVGMMVPVLCCTTLNATNKDNMLPVTFLSFSLGSLLFPIYIVLFIIVLVDVENQEAGGLLFLLMINFIQNVEGSAEIKRLTEWWKAEHGIEARNDVEFAIVLVRWFSGTYP